jgi:hypothetical protein
MSYTPCYRARYDDEIEDEDDDENEHEGTLRNRFTGGICGDNLV